MVDGGKQQEQQNIVQHGSLKVPKEEKSKEMKRKKMYSDG